MFRTGYKLKSGLQLK